MPEGEMIASKWSAGAARSMPAYDDGSVPTLVTEKPPAVAMTQFGEDVARTLTARHDSSPCVDRGQNVVIYPIQGDGRRSCGSQRGKGIGDDEVSYTLNTVDRHSVAYAVRMRAGCDGGGKGALVQEGVSGTLATGNDQTIFEPKPSGYVVRRLTPIECERLQGFPDEWTDLTGCDADTVAEKVAASLHYDEKQKAALLRKVRKWSQECPDGPRYKAIGNSWAVPNVRWIFDRMQAYEELHGREEG